MTDAKTRPLSWLEERQHAANCHCHEFVKAPPQDEPLRAGEMRGRACGWWFDGTPCEAPESEHPYRDGQCRR
jgi:hypothetical protein